MRICVDYRQLNQHTKFDSYPMPRVDELLDAIGQAQYLTTLDLCKGYWLVPLKEEDQTKTAFASPIGLFQFTVMLFGPPATFQRLIDTVLRGTEQFTGVYLDDIVIRSTSWEEHLQHIRRVMERLKQAQLTVNLSKCQFARNHCTYLGHEIGQGVVKPEESKIYAIRNMPRPSTKKELRSFLGLTGYYRRFVRDYASKAVPLTNMIKKSLPEQLTWTKQAEEAFLDLTRNLDNTDYSAQPGVLLQTDAADAGVGAVLSQEEWQDVPIAYFSRKLLDREKNYSTVEKECLAVILGFKAYLLGRQFILQTDHRALKWLHQFKEKNSRLTRWSLALQPYVFTIQH